MFGHPTHPYTQGLIDSIPNIHRAGDRLHTIDGLVPSLYDMPVGCHFRDRCRFAGECPAASGEAIELATMENNHQVRCRRCSANG